MSYKRLTKKADVKLLDCEYSCGSLHLDVVKRLGELEDKIENGTLIELPCKVGDTVWYIKSYGFGRYQVEDMVVAGFNFSRYEDAIWVVGLYEEQSSHIYLTKAEAEKKLEELKGGAK